MDKVQPAIRSHTVFRYAGSARLMDSGFYFRTMTPVVWFAMAMHNCNNKKIIRFNCIKHSIGKNMCQATPDVVLKHSSPLRILFNAV